MREILNEEINYKVERAKNGTPIAYIDPKTSENVYNFKDIIKKHGGKWDAYSKRWYWWLSKDSNESEIIINSQINPAIEELTSVETPMGGERRNPEDIKASVSKMVKELDTILNASSVKGGANSPSESDIKAKVASFKEKIVNLTSSEEFKLLLGPIIKFKQALGHSYSFGNTILIWLQDPKATMVKSKSRWAKVHRRVKEGSPAIMLYSPVGLEPYTPEQKKEIAAAFLKKYDVKSTRELTPGQKEILSVKLSGGNPKGFKLTPSFYDHRFTEVMEGKEDLAPKSNIDDIPWFDDKSPSSEKTVALYDAAIASIEETGIKVNYIDDLGGARGVSRSGVIDVLKDSQKNIGDFNTLVHEFSHELLHQRYLKTRNENDYGSFFVGTDKGRGMVEQQAELSAWIICQYFGYEMPTSVNYMGCWGMDEKSAAKVFDTVADTSSKIIEMVSKNLKHNIEEGIEKRRREIITGEELANKLGLGDLYHKSKQMEKSNFSEGKLNKIIDNVLAEAFSTTIKKSLNEAINSQYTHFAVNKKTNLIVNGWDYSDYDNSELRSFADDYFWDDMRDYEFNPKEYKILSRQGCLKQGINPDDEMNCWSNRGDIPLRDEQK